MALPRRPDIRAAAWAASLTLAACAALGALAVSETRNRAGAPETAAPASSAAATGARVAASLTPFAVRPIDPRRAAAINAATPVARLPNPAAAPLPLRFGEASDEARSLQCMTEAIYYEAATEPADGQRAVAQVILNRLRHPAYPHSVCGVVYQGHERRTGCQFSFTCDGALARQPHPALWARARLVAAQALAGSVYAPVGLATHYHADYVVPYWASSLIKAATIGAHIFYRWPGGWGRPDAFSARYAGVEPVIVRRRDLPSPGAPPASLAGAGFGAGTAEPDAAAAPAASIDSFRTAVLGRYSFPRRRPGEGPLSDQPRIAGEPGESAPDGGQAAIGPILETGQVPNRRWASEDDPPIETVAERGPLTAAATDEAPRAAPVARQ